MGYKGQHIIVTKQTRRKTKSKNIITKIWDEFLFARNFEYETPLTPDEMADALKKIDEKEHKTWLSHSSSMVYNMNYDRHGDKGGDFTIDLQSKHQGKWWAGNTTMQQAEGTITANSETGMTTLKGRTRFSGQYYLAFLFMFMINFLNLSLQNNGFFQIIWLIFIVVFWYSMYHERNKLADHVDQLIMNAKSDASIAHLIDDTSRDDYFEDDLIIRAENYS